MRGRFVGDINQQTRGVRENFTLVSSLHAYNLQQFAWWVVERKWFRVPPIQILADPFEARYFPKHYSIEGEPGPRPNPADIPYRRGDFVTIIAGGLDETGYVHAVCQHPCVVSVGPFKEHPPPTILYSVLSTARRFCCDTFYDEDLRGPKIDLPQKPPPQSCWWVREREFCENDDRVRLDFEYMKEPRKGFEVNHIVSVQVPGLAERQPALVVKTWTSPDAPVYYEAYVRLSFVCMPAMRDTRAPAGVLPGGLSGRSPAHLQARRASGAWRRLGYRCIQACAYVLWRIFF